MKKYPESFRHDIAQANELWIVGANLATSSNIYFDLFVNLLQRGGKIKVLIIDPNSHASSHSAARILRGETPDSVRIIILTSLFRLCKVRETCPSQMEIHTIDYVPSFGMFGVDVESQRGVFYIEHYGYKLKDDLPKFELRPHDGEWYELFGQQLNALWADSKEWHYTQNETRQMLAQ